MRHLWGGDGIKGDKFFWMDEDYEPHHRDYFHSRHCPCLNNGKQPKWEFDNNNNYIPVDELTPKEKL